ncbi:MAG TPA: dihydropteroate synthase [Candidatus Didemnitutus sp.]|nr:dihydropteroate synthase [Candidatus Didemnitutus sp.]
MPRLVGILNVTPDSFFDGGRHSNLDAALKQAGKMAAEGAAMLDVGGQSTRPGYVEVPASEEIARVVPVISALAGQIGIPISVDTYQPEVALAAVKAGATIINDVHGFQRRPELADIAAQNGCGAILMHNDPSFREAAGGTLERVLEFLERSIAIALAAGVRREGIIVDPGIGFAKTDAQNLEILARLGELRVLGFPLLLGASRKSVIGNALRLPPAERLEGTLAITALAVWQGVDYLRVHDVLPNLRAARMAQAVRVASDPTA